MLLTIDVGNTQSVLGLYDLESDVGEGAAVGLVDHWRLSTDAERTSDEYSVLIRSLLNTAGVDLETDLTGTAICSGVPRILAGLREMVTRYLPFDPIVIEPGVKTGIPILYDNPKEVGADRIANAIAAFDLYGGPRSLSISGPATISMSSLSSVNFSVAQSLPVLKSALMRCSAALRRCVRLNSLSHAA